jgi:hypothetical protein
MGAPKRMPSFSQRPGFPCGLRVLLVDSDADARSRTEEQLRQCSYEVRARDGEVQQWERANLGSRCHGGGTHGHGAPPAWGPTTSYLCGLGGGTRTLCSRGDRFSG